MIILNEKWQDTGHGDEETTGRWIHDRFYGPICDIEVLKHDDKRIRIRILDVHVEAESAMSDFTMLCLMAREFLQDYSEVVIAVTRLKRSCKFTKEEDVAETLTDFIKQASLL